MTKFKNEDGCDSVAISNSGSVMQQDLPESKNEGGCYKIEPQLQAVVRRVVAKAVRALGDEASANLLESADPAALAELGPLIDEAFHAWEQQHKIIAPKENSMMWTVYPTLEISEGDGPIIHLHWGWDKEARLTMIGEDAFDLAEEIFEIFHNENGVPVRPKRPDPKSNESLLNQFSKLEPIGQEYQKIAGVEGYSFLDLDVWIKLGKPNPIPKHQWINYPEDGVQICNSCSHWYYTNGDDFPTEVCPGKPTDDLRTTKYYDPRRSPALREAHRLDKLILRMKDNDARQKEIDTILDSLSAIKNLLTEDEKKRFEKERVGL